MAEIYEDYITRKMSRAEHKLLTDEEKKERVKAQYRIYEKNRPKRDRTEYRQTPACKKSNTISLWKSYGLKESPENLDRIYNLYLTQELCNACDCVLTRDGIRCPTQAQMDHCHISHRFRHIICHACNSYDNWKKHFC